MASDRARNVLDMYEAVIAFDGVHSAEYAVGLPGAAAEFARMTAAHTNLEGHIADQTSGASTTAVVAKSLLRAAALRREKEFRQTAIALKYTIPGLDKSFKMPAHDGDMEVVARGREMIQVAADNAAAFTAFGMPPARGTELAAILDDIEAMGQTKDAAVQEKVGATAGIDQEIDEGMEAATILNAMMKNFYRDDPSRSPNGAPRDT